MLKNPNLYFCNICDFKCNKQSNFNVHCSTSKHIKKTQSDKNLETNLEPNIVTYECIVCNKKYKSRNGLWLHKKSCKEKEELTDITNNEIIKKDIKKLIMPIEERLDELNKIPQIIEFIKHSQEIYKQNLELQQQLYIQMLDIIKMSKNTTN